MKKLTAIVHAFCLLIPYFLLSSNLYTRESGRLQPFTPNYSHLFTLLNKLHQNDMTYTALIPSLFKAAFQPVQFCPDTYLATYSTADSEQAFDFHTIHAPFYDTSLFTPPTFNTADYTIHPLTMQFLPIIQQLDTYRHKFCLYYQSVLLSSYSWLNEFAIAHAMIEQLPLSFSQQYYQNNPLYPKSSSTYYTNSHRYNHEVSAINDRIKSISAFNIPFDYSLMIHKLEAGDDGNRPATASIAFLSSYMNDMDALLPYQSHLDENIKISRLSSILNVLEIDILHFLSFYKVQLTILHATTHNGFLILFFNIVTTTLLAVKTALSLPITLLVITTIVYPLLLKHCSLRVPAVTNGDNNDNKTLPVPSQSHNSQMKLFYGLYLILLCNYLIHYVIMHYILLRVIIPVVLQFTSTLFGLIRAQFHNILKTSIKQQAQQLLQASIKSRNKSSVPTIANVPAVMEPITNDIELQFFSSFLFVLTLALLYSVSVPLVVFCAGYTLIHHIICKTVLSQL